MQGHGKILTESVFYKLYLKYKAFVRFVVVGCINTGVDFLVFTLFKGPLGADKLVSQVAGYTMGVVNSFIMNKLWTFENRSAGFDTAGQAVRFAAVNVVSLGVSLAGLKLLCDSFGINVYVSKLIVTVAAQLVNYSGYKLWVFASAKAKAKI